MIEIVHRYIIPGAYAVLPPAMTSPEATAMLLAIGLQESGFTHRRQADLGPARGFWQFERAGVVGLILSPRTQSHLRQALTALSYSPAPRRRDALRVQRVLQHNDVLACVLARLLLWTLPQRLPTRNNPVGAWEQYLAAWRPGKPRRESWDQHFADAWERLDRVLVSEE